MNYWQGATIRLRGLEPADAAFFHHWNEDTGTQKFLDHIWFPSTLTRVQQWAEKTALKEVNEDEFFFVIEDLNGNPVGMIHPSHCDKRNGNFSYGIGVVEEARRKGYAIEAAQMVLRYYFNELHYHKACVGIIADNEASIALHRKLGFKEEGRLREMGYRNGIYHDLLKFGLLKREFRS